MKSRTLFAVMYSLTFVALAVWLRFERRACAQIHQENTALLQRLSEATEKLTENQRLPPPAALDNFSGPGTLLPGAPPGVDDELARLRGQVAGLLEQHQQTESLRDDTRQTRAALENRRKEDRAARQALNGSVSQLEIIKAEYWTENTRMDVTDELQDRIRGDSLKAMANNGLKGDPEFGKTKHLTVEYRFGGVTRTNEFREGAVIVLPAE
jgi:hypothetical protein